MSSAVAEKPEMLVDILEEKRKQNDLIWIIKPFQPSRVCHNDSSPANPLIFRYKVLTDQDLLSIMKKVRFSVNKTNEFITFFLNICG